MKRNFNILLIIISLVAISFSFAKKQENSCVKMKNLIGRWVLMSKDANLNVFSQTLDTLVFVPYESKLTNDLHPALKNAGIRFEKNGVFYKHVWNRCGTGNPPSFDQGTWEVTKNKKQDVLKITFEKQEREFIISCLKRDQLILIRK